MVPNDTYHAHGLTPDLLTPGQFHPEAARRQGSGVRRLMAALLEDAAHIYARNAGAGETSRLFQEAKAWVDSDDHAWPFSFERVCEALLLDAAWVRGRLRAIHSGSRHGVVDVRSGRKRRTRAVRRGDAVRAPGRGALVSIAVLSRALEALAEQEDDGATRPIASR
jgi:hypothetical protein